jgi:acetoin utilization protein AcuC
MFFYHPRMLAYDFGPQHPLRPERLRRTVEILGAFGVESVDPGEGSAQDPLRVHSAEYVEAVRIADQLTYDEATAFGIATGDTPRFPGMYEASIAYTAGSARAAEEVKDGAQLAISLSGGLHHAQRSNASGFCVFNDCAVAISILRERFAKVAYVDIDVHHGDGVQAIFYEDPTVLTCSIHQNGRTLYPGTGSVSETGADNASINVPLWPGTSPSVWLWAFRNGILPKLEAFNPEAIVLQMGTDSHALDPLAAIENNAQTWLEAVKDIQATNKPLVALGGGGYNLTTVPRMWVAATLTLLGISVPESVPEPYGSEWGLPRFFDPEPEPTDAGLRQAEEAVAQLRML